MPIYNAAGTVFPRTAPGILESIYFTGGTFGTVSVYDAAGTPLPGTPVAQFVPSARDYSARGIDIPLVNGCAVVFAAATTATVITRAHARK